MNWIVLALLALVEFYAGMKVGWFLAFNHVSECPTDHRLGEEAHDGDA